MTGIVWNFFLHHWLMSTVGLTVLIGVFLFFIMSFLGILTNLGALLGAFAPLIKGINEGIVWYIKTFWTGLGQLLHNLAIMAVVAPLLTFVWLYTHHYVTAKCSAELQELHHDYVFTPRKKAD